LVAANKTYAECTQCQHQVELAALHTEASGDD
jgi:hypothetical protein